MLNPIPGVGRCDADIAFEFVDGPVPGTTLEILGNDRVFFQTGSDRLLDFDTLALFEPEDVRLTTRDGRRFDLDLSAGVTAVTDANDNRVTITAGGIQHSAGVSIDFERDEAGRIVEIADPLGHSNRYGYDDASNLVHFTDRAGHPTQFAYSTHLLEAVTDPRGIQAVRSEFDAAGRLIKVLDASGRATTFDRDLEARREVVIDPLGHSRILQYDPRGNVVRETDALGAVTQRTFDARDHLLSETDPLGFETTFTYSSSHDLLAMRGPLEEEARFTYTPAGDVSRLTDPQGQVILSSYDARGNLLAMTDPSGATTSFTHDSRGNVLTETDALDNVTTRSYDGRGNLIREQDPLGVETSFTYNALGDRLTESVLRTTATGPEILVTQYAYDEVGRIVAVTYADGTTVGTTYDGRGNILEEVDALGGTTRYAYDEVGRDIAVTHPDGTREIRTYDAAGNLIASTNRAGSETTLTYDPARRLVRTTLPDGAAYENVYDLAGRLTATIDPRGHVTSYTYDAAGCQIEITNPLGQTTQASYDEAGRRVSVTDPHGQITRFEHDANGRITRTTFPDGATTQAVYDALGNLTRFTDPLGATTRRKSNALGRLLEVEDALGAVIRYAYDEVGNLVSQVDALGRETRFEYDRMGRPTRRILPDGATENQEFDAAGNPTRRTDFAGHTTRNAYDPNGRLIRRTYPDGSRAALTYTPTGRRQTVTDSRGTTRYRYDLLDRLVELTSPQGGQLTYSYDAAGNRTSLGTSFGDQVLNTTSTWDAAHRLATVTDPDGGVYPHAYDASGNRESLAYPNGVETRYAYDSRHQLIRLTTRNAAEAILQEYAYTLDAVGRRLGVEEHDGNEHDNTVRAHGFDARGQLVGETVRRGADLLYENRFAYDLVGNRLSQEYTAPDGAITTTASVFDPRDRLLLTGGKRQLWGANGNLTETTGKATYSWDFADRLHRVARQDGTVVTHRYDFDGIRVQTEVAVPGGESHVVDYVVDPTGALPQVIAEISGGEIASYYVRGDDLLAVIRPSGARYYHADGQMSVRVLTDESATVTDRYAYEAFGSLHQRQGEDANPFLYGGEAFDVESGFSYHRARWVDPQAGRFLSMDPFTGFRRDPLTLHKYLYAGNNPVDQSDPTGLYFSGGLTGLGATMAIGGLVNGVFSAIFSNSSPTNADFWGDIGKGVAVGALTAPVGGLLAKALAPLVRSTIRPLLRILGNLEPLKLPGKKFGGQLLVRISRFFFNTNKHYPPANSTFLGRALIRLFPNAGWQQHHVFIQQAWSRVGGPNQLYDDIAANDGLKRLGNGLWNLLPIPATLNNALGRSVIGTQVLATTYYSILAYGPWHTLTHFLED